MPLAAPPSSAFVGEAMEIVPIHEHRTDQAVHVDEVFEIAEVVQITGAPGAGKGDAVAFGQLGHGGGSGRSFEVPVQLDLGQPGQIHQTVIRASRAAR
jgi:hypothetical protein